MLDDTAGDTVVDSSGKPRPDGRADLTQTRATYTKDLIVLTAQTAQRGDPAQDPNWASDTTFLSWELDTDGDGVPDYEVEFLLDEGTPVAGVGRTGDKRGESLCETEAGYRADSYAVGFKPDCLGLPAAFSYRIKIYYDTNPKDENADVLTDMAPDGGVSLPVKRSAG